ncbi:hypothetical protein AXF42_Ash021652 [Apostasia shenzhenica]|uniref:Uncharacterized protein n=1 Tax=Apostasia shenzhenica TaxID=1088818 RepID=A0A2H9ZTN1_9ASPA|nr:hypothetical protein AXF42_Ash021652 [Apostasia shenzhenica]
MYKKFIEEKDEEARYVIPDNYNFISQQDWNLFVSYHISEEFLDELATQATQGTIHPEGRSDLFALTYEEPKHPEPLTKSNLEHEGSTSSSCWNPHTSTLRPNFWFFRTSQTPYQPPGGSPKLPSTLSTIITRFSSTYFSSFSWRKRSPLSRRSGPPS